MTEVHARPDGDTCFAGDRSGGLAGGRARCGIRPAADDSADYSYVTYRRRDVALTAFGNVYIDNYRLRHSCFEPTSCVVRAGAVPYKAERM